MVYLYYSIKSSTFAPSKKTSGNYIVDGIAIQEDVGGVEGDVVARHVPDATILTAVAPRILDHIVWATLLVSGLAIDKHHVVVSESPVVPLLLAKLLGGLYAIGQHSQASAGEVACDVTTPGHAVTCINGGVEDAHKLVDGHVVAGLEAPLVGGLDDKPLTKGMMGEAG